MKDNMRKILLALFSLLALNSIGQDVLISVHEQNILVAGVHNYLDIKACGIPDDSLFITMTNGTILKKDYAYIAIPERLGNSYISVYKINEDDTVSISMQGFRVIHLCKYFEAYIGSRIGGNISKEDLLLERGIFASVNGLGFDLRLTVSSYRLLVLRDNDLLFNQEQNSNKFSAEMREVFESLIPGDLLYFLDITVLYGDSANKKYFVNPIRLVIK